MPALANASEGWQLLHRVRGPREKGGAASAVPAIGTWHASHDEADTCPLFASRLNLLQSSATLRFVGSNDCNQPSARSEGRWSLADGTQKFFPYPAGVLTRGSDCARARVIPRQPIGLHRACAAFERAADPLHRTRIDAEPLGNDAHTWPFRSCQRLPDLPSISGAIRGRPSRLPSLFARASPARTHS